VCWVEQEPSSKRRRDVCYRPLAILDSSIGSTTKKHIKFESKERKKIRERVNNKNNFLGQYMKIHNKHIVKIYITTNLTQKKN
jgi:hypothetical protein